MSEIPALPLSTLLYETNFNLEELAINHRVREINGNYLSHGYNSIKVRAVNQQPLYHYSS